MSNDIVGQHFYLFRLFTVIEVLEVTEADMAFGYAHQHSAAFRLLPKYWLIAGDDRQRARGRNGQMV
ncbi:hypothetical protein D3C73_1674880 [compost metagenome]